VTTRAVVLIFAAVLLVTIGACAGRSWDLVLYRLLTDGVIALLWLGAAAGFGGLMPLPLAAAPAERPLRLITATALGLGAIGLIVLALGSAGWLNQVVSWSIISIGLALAIIRSLRHRAAFNFNWPNRQARAQWLLLAVAPLLGLALVAAMVPPGILWGDEPNGYDVLEYHLQLPREWYELGRISTLQHNVFSFFPSGMEMHYLLAMHLRGGPWAGMYLAQLMHAAMCALMALAVYAIARKENSPAATLAAVAAASVPWITLLAPVAYNEGALLLFATLAIGWALPAAGAEETTGPLRRPLVSGALAGLACGDKFTAVPMILIGLPVTVLLASLWQRRISARLFLGCGIFFISTLLVFAPWLIRNTADAGNPVFPEGQNLFGRAHFSETQSQRWRVAHSPTPMQRPLLRRLGAFVQQVVADWRYGYMFIFIAIYVAGLTWRRSGSGLLILMLIWVTVFWLGSTHLQGRFLVIAIPLTALLVARLKGTAEIWGTGALVGLEMILAYALLAGRYTDRVAPLAEKGLLGIERLDSILPQEITDALTLSPSPGTPGEGRAVAEGDRAGEGIIALAGDARAFIYSVPMSRLHYRTVFDVDIKPSQTLIDAWTQDAGDADVIVVDPLELERFARTYYGIPPLPPEFPGPRDRMFVIPRHSPQNEPRP
jgi:hypothetical protein